MKVLLRLFLAIAGVILFAWFFIPGMITGHFHIGVLTGAGIGVVLFFYGIFFTQINAAIGRLGKHIAGKVIISAVVLCLCAIIALAGACIFCMVRACHTLPEGDQQTADTSSAPDSSGDSSSIPESEKHSPTVLVLGCRVYSYGPSLSLISRMDAAMEYLNEHPSSCCIVCGGQGDGEPMTEALAMYNYMTARGIPAERIFMEDASVDTKENLANASEIIKNNGLNPQTVISTNDYHIYRALEYARSAGIGSPGALPADTLWWLFPSLTVREMYGIMEMWFLN